jgi:predicted ATP-dependent serine protease
LDLALAVAIWSSYHDRTIDSLKVYVWELGLTGQVQPSKLHDKRKKETPTGYEFFDYTVCNHIRLLWEFLG